MNTTALPGNTFSSGWKPTWKIGPMGLIVLAHVGLLYVLQNGLAKHSPETRVVPPKEVIATFIQPEAVAPPTPEPPKPAPTPPKPKTVPVVKKAFKQPPKPLAPTPTPIPAQPQAESTPVQAPVSPEPPVPAAPAAAPAPVAATAAQPKLVSGVEYIRQPEPKYPAAAKRMGEEGKVMIRLLINENGRPERAEVQQSSGSSRLDEAAKQAAMGALFKPYTENGKPIPVYATVPIAFNITK